MNSLDEKVENQKVINFGEMKIGDWELDTSDPLSPYYEPPLKDIVLGVLYTPIYYLGRLKNFSLAKARSTLQEVAQYFRSIRKRT